MPHPLLLLPLTADPASALAVRKVLETARTLRKNERKGSLATATAALLDGE